MSLMKNILACVCIVSYLASCVVGFCKAQEKEAPNILILLVDDQRNDTLGCSGHPIIKTPSIDFLARNGVRFENAFVTTSICAASRATIFSGLYERTHGYTFGKQPLSKDVILSSYPAILRKAGYRTGFIGKYGIRTRGKPESEMFDFFRPHGRNPYFKKQADGSLRHETDIAGDQAIKFLKGNPKGKPFCLSISFNAVHAEDGDKKNHFPWPKFSDKLYRNVQIPAPRLSDPAIFENHPPFLKRSMNRKRYFWRWDTKEKYQKNIKAYFRMISGVDNVVGRLRKELDRLGFSRNTIIIYMADNGYYMGERGFAGKWSHFEPSLRIPLIVFDPRQPENSRGKVVQDMALNIDIPATVLNLLNQPIPPSYQGRSLVPILNQKDSINWRSDFFCEHLMNHPDIPKWEGVRGKRYVYARYFEQNPVYEFLHDLEKDPDQLKNYSKDPKYKKILLELRDRCDQLKDNYQLKQGSKLKPKTSL